MPHIAQLAHNTGSISRIAYARKALPISQVIYDHCAQNCQQQICDPSHKTEHIAVFYKCRKLDRCIIHNTDTDHDGKYRRCHKQKQIDRCQHPFPYFHFFYEKIRYLFIHVLLSNCYFPILHALYTGTCMIQHQKQEQDGIHIHRNDVILCQIDRISCKRTQDRKYRYI